MRSSISLALFITFSAAITAFAAEPADHEDPRWWFRQATAAIEHIKDPEAKHLIGDILRTAQGQVLSPAQAAMAIDEQLAALRTKAGPDNEWQYHYSAAQLYASAGQHEKALAALRQGRTLALAKLAGKAAARLEEEFDSRLSDMARSAAQREDRKFSLAFAAEIQDARQRETAHRSLATHWASESEWESCFQVIDAIEKPETRHAVLTELVTWVTKKDRAAGKQLLSRISPTARAQSERLFFMASASSGKQEDLQRAVEMLVRDSATMDEQELARCLSALNQVLTEAPGDLTLDEAIDKSFEALLRTTAAGKKNRAADDARRCLADYLFRTGRYEALLEATVEWKESAQGLCEVYRKKVVLHYAANKRCAEAIALVREKGQRIGLGPEDAELFLTAGEPMMALEITGQMDNFDYAAPTMNKIALEFARRGEPDAIEQVLEKLHADDLRIGCLAALAQQAMHDKHEQQAAKYAARAKKLLPKLPRDERQVEAAQRLASALTAIGDARAAEELMQKYADGGQRAARHLSLARNKLEAKDEQGFMKEMAEFERRLTREQLTSGAPVAPAPYRSRSHIEALPDEGPPPPPPGGVSPAPRFVAPTTAPAGAPPPLKPMAPAAAPPAVKPATPMVTPRTVKPMAPTYTPAPMNPIKPMVPMVDVSPENETDIASTQVQLAIFGAKQYFAAGKPAEAQALMRRALAEVEGTGGVFWRVELYADMMQDVKTPEQFKQLAQMAEAVPSPDDRAILMVLGGAMLAHQQRGPLPMDKPER
jgi:hypothetical protein